MQAVALIAPFEISINFILLYICLAPFYTETTNAFKWGDKVDPLKIRVFLSTLLFTKATSNVFVSFENIYITFESLNAPTKVPAKVKFNSVGRDKQKVQENAANMSSEYVEMPL